ncbi:MAG: riboflavin synthase [SAR202 cluster bacterium]|nr:riboflavin synthase [SAR202 cluster bacterium]
MFTGIVEELGKILKISDSEIHIQASVVLSDLEVKDSVSVNGVCLTAVEKSDDNFLVNVVPETLRRTNLGTLSSGSLVNLERSVSYGGRIGGHLVQGHVDGTGEITEIIPDGDAEIIVIQIDRQFSKYIVEKGYICVDGASLTVVKCDENSFSITLIPYTKKHTVFGIKTVGDLVNIEVDMISKYVENILKLNN